jgi:excisionase family DNA binding protein
LLSLEEATAYLGHSRDTVYTWIECKAMPAHKLYRLRKVQAKKIEALVRGGDVAIAADKQTPTRP